MSVKLSVYDGNLNPKDFNNIDNQSDTFFIEVRGNVQLSHVGLKDIPASFNIVQGAFAVADNNLKSLKGSPHTAKSFYCHDNNITSLDYICRTTSTIDIRRNHIQSLIGVHKLIDRCTRLLLNGNPIKEGGIGLIFIKDLHEITFDRSGSEFPMPSSFITKHSAFEIISKYLQQGKNGVLACQQELIDNGYELFARL